MDSIDIREPRIQCFQNSPFACNTRTNNDAVNFLWNRPFYRSNVRVSFIIPSAKIVAGPQAERFDEMMKWAGTTCFSCFAASASLGFVITTCFSQITQR